MDMIDPKLQRCQCGYCWRPTTWQKLLMLVNGEYLKRCPRCQSTMRLVFIGHVVVTERRNIDKKELWQRC
jgi:NAD-dependent SIR2 family protein deacetylase